MKIGLMIPPSIDPARVPVLAAAAEDAGFDYVASGEHVFFHGPVSNAFINLAGAAATTSTIRLLSALTILPMYPPVLAAKLAATLDRISGGRFELGVGVGGEFPPEFAAAGADLTTRGRRTDEALEVMRELFAGGPVDFDGPYTRIPGLELDPLPVQQNGPRIWIGGRKGAAIRRTAKYGDVWFPYLMEAGRVSAGLIEARALAGQFNRPADAIDAGYLGWGAVHDNSETARSMAVELVSATYNQDFSALADRYLVAGNPEQVIGRIRDYEAAGTSRFIFSPACQDADIEAMIALFASEVLPALRMTRSPTIPEPETQS